MKEYLKNIDEDKIKIIYDIKVRYDNGEISLEKAQDELLERVKKVTASEIAYIEQEFQDTDEDECQKTKLQEMIAIFDKVRKPVDFNLPKDHPVKSYLLENQIIKDSIDKLNLLIEKDFVYNQWLEEYDKLLAYKVHFSRKQNQLYSILEKRGFDRPTKIMWTLDDYIKDEINQGYELLKAKKIDELKKHQKILSEDILDLMGKEEQVLYPTSLDMLNEDDFRNLRSGDDEIGYANIEAPTEFLPKDNAKDDNFKDELANLLGKYGYINKEEKDLKVSEGLLSLERINLIFKNLPIDISYVDENNKVRFYSDTEHRVFPRSKGVIGRDVKNCHPQKSVHIVEEIIDAFRENRQDRAEFWINQEGVFIYIIYIAIRDENGNYKGVLEMMQDARHIRSLEGSQTLLNWSDTKTEKVESKEDQKDESQDGLKITKDTKLVDILKIKPEIKEKLINYNSSFKMLKSPLAKIIMPKATVSIMSERSKVPLKELIDVLEKWIKE